MRIALINPPITSKERYSRDIGAVGGHQAPLGLCYLASYLQRYGCEAVIIDAEAELLSDDAVVGRLKDFNPDFAGITSTTVAFKRAVSLATAIKYFNPSLPVIIGGPHVTACPDGALSYPCFDYGVLREGEATLQELLTALRDHMPVENLQGIAYRRGGRIITTTPRPYIGELDSLPPPARSLLSPRVEYLPPIGCYRARPVFTMLTSRGCPYGCIFCDKNVFGAKTRYFSPAYVISEMKELVRCRGAREIFFVDDTFTLNRERLNEILSLMRSEKLEVGWSCMTRADHLTKDLLRQMKDAGCWQVSIGIESGNREVLGLTGKGVSLEQISDAVRWASGAGLHVKGFFMLGHPAETLATIDETIAFAGSLPLSDIVVTLATPMPGTPFHALVPRYGSMQRTDWSEFSYWKAVFVPHGLSEAELYRKQKEFYTRFYLRPDILLKQAAKMR